MADWQQTPSTSFLTGAVRREELSSTAARGAAAVSPSFFFSALGKAPRTVCAASRVASTISVIVAPSSLEHRDELRLLGALAALALSPCAPPAPRSVRWAPLMRPDCRTCLSDRVKRAVTFDPESGASCVCGDRRNALAFAGFAPDRVPAARHDPCHEPLGEQRAHDLLRGAAPEALGQRQRQRVRPLAGGG